MSDMNGMQNLDMSETPEEVYIAPKMKTSSKVLFALSIILIIGLFITYIICFVDAVKKTGPKTNDSV